MWADPVVTRHIGGKPSTREESWSRLLRYGGLWPLLGFGYWVIEEKSSGRFAGEAGFADFRRALEPSFGDTPEAGWALAAWAQGKGFSTEAVLAAVAWADANLSAPRTACMIDPGNMASISVAQKCGYREFARATFRDKPTVLFERHRG
jgi:RimJ/RimL family protein N-acetyltransferase